jgi:beta-lactamase superfamily II metal-dependent hydrolase
MFCIEMLPAEQGDALWVEYGSPRRPHRLLIDAGVRKTSAVLRERIAELPKHQRRFDLLVITHVDSDHVGGVPQLLAGAPPGLSFDDVWFNAWRHLPAVPDRLGPVEGEIVSAQLDALAWPWNVAFDGEAVVVPTRGKLPTRELPGGMKLTLLSPTLDRLVRLRGEWKKTVREARLDPGRPGKALSKAARRRGIPDLLGERLDVARLAASRFTPDREAANGSTIAFLAEYAGASCLFTGDAHPEVLEASLNRLCKERRVHRLSVDALKVPHHGSAHNVSSALLALVETGRYLFSTSGSQTDHPDPEAVARIVARGASPVLAFNYRSETTGPWAERRLIARHRYRPMYPSGPPGLRVDL